MLWLKRWLRKSKPTEWISSLATTIAVLAAIASGVVAYNTGFLDAKTERLKIDQQQLIDKKISLDREISESTKRLEQAESAMTLAVREGEKARADVQEIRKQFETYRIGQDRYEAMMKVNSIFDSLSSEYEGGWEEGKYIKAELHCDQAFTPLWVRADVKTTLLGKKQIALKEKMTFFSALRSVSDLQSLDISGIELTEQDIQAISQMKSLKFLALRNTSIDNRLLAFLRPPPLLKGLILESNPFTDLPESVQCKSLTSLNIEQVTGVNYNTRRVCELFPELTSFNSLTTKYDSNDLDELLILDKLENVSVDMRKLPAAKVKSFAFRFGQLPRKSLTLNGFSPDMLGNDFLSSIHDLAPSLKLAPKEQFAPAIKTVSD